MNRGVRGLETQHKELLVEYKMSQEYRKIVVFQDKFEEGFLSMGRYKNVHSFESRAEVSIF